ncbi:MAG: hypothetical protein US95_C0006G0025 [Candidatus Woesebacteria bacterium GW2011_GWB1_38_5]|uniref:DUF4870 domain-containing protein n=4 Tax=Candidatus Woeseibacteriota TaxID=1752722 RepID=A0A0G0KYY7_9BACT|nr:MAG: hypothetical protein US67_C0025G0009 [Candidatus Woesebacteria bacterium GW2011_GWD1_38_10]KKQ55620.1 MAG: hypothetical protein US75_C0017G0014 [Candidatus Woesebacteria bacterium GW2011_GWC1_38_13]KKQ75303.1 MAG: hypothetical protein US95_C0006G0025 [Candidatus Woesebacteria bacterium GW2011_GWB1_38_5]KKQ83957.1 MAG: hypothetical protein UT06_C0012G0022 [Candidatus Woesebacteria bacterium GW2011_GWA1_38_8]
MADEKKGLTGLPKNTAGALSYVLGPITGVVFYILEKDPFVKFHAMQSIVVFGVIFIVQWSLAITIILVGISGLLGVLSFVLWLVLIFKAWKGEEWEVPYLGRYARMLVKKV